MRNLVLGESGCGKSRLMREVIVPYWARRGFAVLVLDPVGQDWRSVGAAWQTKDHERFLATARKSQKCVLVVDEAEETLRGSAEQERQMNWLGLQSRNFGHESYFLGQRALQVPPNVRNQCGRVYAFTQDLDDSLWIAKKMLQRDIAEAITRLPEGICLRVQRHKTPVKMRVFDP